MKNIALHNLGCKVNSYETEVMQQKLQEKGYKIVPFDTVADVYIVNTCTVTNIADRKSRQMLHRARQLNPEAVVVAVGCYVQTGQKALEEDAQVDLAIGNNRKKDIVEILEAYLAGHPEGQTEENPGQAGGEGSVQHPVTEVHGRSAEESSRKTLGGNTVLDIGQTYEYEEMRLCRTAEHTRAYIKIQDGCNQFCSYCAIPLARGRVRSRKAEDILEEVKGMVAAGYREIVLTGIHISSYGVEFAPEPWQQGISQPRWKGKRLEYGSQGRLIDLVERIHGIPGLERIRLSSMEPRIITRETAVRLAALPKLCPHFHLSLQSGSDAVLKRMNRHYTTGEYFRSVEILRQIFPDPAITTDVIVGFPGETEEEFRETKDFLEKVCFYEMHIFKYSRRAKTAAASMPGQVPEPVKAARSNELLEMERRQSAAFRARYIGRQAEVLLEETKELDGRGYVTGHTRDYVKVAVWVDSLGDPCGNADMAGSGSPGPAREAQLFRNRLCNVQVKGFLTDEILEASFAD